VWTGGRQQWRGSSSGASSRGGKRLRQCGSRTTTTSCLAFRRRRGIARRPGGLVQQRLCSTSVASSMTIDDFSVSCSVPLWLLWPCVLNERIIMWKQS
jgi:hypothetical protein